METIRQTMIKTRISDVVNGKFMKKEGLEPSYILTGLGQRISRANLLGTIVDKFVSEDGNYSTISVDDDSDSIRVKAFKEEAKVFDNLEVGDLVMIIGKVREYAEENYIIPEIVKKIADPNYEPLHKLEVLKQLVKQKKIMEEIKGKEKIGNIEELKKKYDVDSEAVESVVESLSVEEEKEVDYKPFVLETLDKLDKGKGVEFKKLLLESKLQENIFEEVINELLSNGSCFEPKPGILKRV